eukprot:5618259-Amphidinium_carterae.2
MGFLDCHNIGFFHELLEDLKPGAHQRHVSGKKGGRIPSSNARNQCLHPSRTQATMGKLALSRQIVMQSGGPCGRW